MQSMAVLDGEELVGVDNKTTLENNENHIKHTMREVEQLALCHDGLLDACSKLARCIDDLDALGFHVGQLQLAANFAYGYSDLITTRLHHRLNERLTSYAKAGR